MLAIKTISKINFAGKWVEFWFAEGGKSERGFDVSCKTYMLNTLTVEMDNDIANYGYVGRRVVINESPILGGDND